MPTQDSLVQPSGAKAMDSKQLRQKGTAGDFLKSFVATHMPTDLCFLQSLNWPLWPPMNHVLFEFAAILGLLLHVLCHVAASVPSHCGHP